MLNGGNNRSVEGVGAGMVSIVADDVPVRATTYRESQFDRESAAIGHPRPLDGSIDVSL